MSRTKYTSFNLRRPRISMYSLRTGSLRTHVSIPPVRLAAILPTLVASRRHPPRHSPLLTSTTVFSTDTTSSRHHLRTTSRLKLALAIHTRRSRIQIYSRSAASAGLPTTRTMLVISYSVRARTSRSINHSTTGPDSALATLVLDCPGCSRCNYTRPHCLELMRSS